MSIIIMIIVGFVVGLIARAIMPGDQNMGIIMTTILGIVGSVVAGFLGQSLAGTRRANPPGGSDRSSARSSCCSWLA